LAFSQRHITLRCRRARLIASRMLTWHIWTERLCRLDDGASV
jgi:hypothetical protein